MFESLSAVSSMPTESSAAVSDATVAAAKTAVAVVLLVLPVLPVLVVVVFPRRDEALYCWREGLCSRVYTTNQRFLTRVGMNWILFLSETRKKEREKL